MDSNELKAILIKTNFHELGGKLDELGLGAAFSVGKKKSEIIDDALKLYASKQEPEEKGPDQDPTDPEIDPDADYELEEDTEEDEGEEGNEEPLPEKEQPKVKEPAKAKQETKAEGPKPKHSREVIEKNIANCQLNLINCTPEKRKLLIQKLSELESMLK